ncbi:hypothetical protein TIFTF001_025391 [Ficus carica]|uniref:F-box domain-containing protein n=1 Tax=Ficus carica TaxID=3494 RepID=A0AA88AWP8_FICCA|nr:hypothetical protein TIFTF001_025391 [Ficus carica]
MENDGPIMDGTSKLELPEEVIHKIFSFLSRKDAIRASALSRQWRSAWISYSVFFFDDNAEPFKNEDFFNYVDTSLALWRDRCDNQVNMERSCLHTHIADGGCVYRLNQVLATAASRAVKAIELYNRELEPLTVADTCSLLPVLFTCNLLRTLSLGRFEFYIPNSLSLPVMSSVSTLYLRSMIIDKDGLENLLSRFPSLRY